MVSVQHTVTPTAEDRLWGIANSIAVDRAGETSRASFLTYDAPGELGAFDVNDPGVLAGIVGQEYLRRVVGKFHASLQGNATDGVPNATQVFPPMHPRRRPFVARTDGSGSADIDIPIGANDSRHPRAELQSLEGKHGSRAVDLASDLPPATPPKSSSGDKVSPPQVSPRSNKSRRRSRGPRGHGSVADGPHVDAKTARRVTQDERLWLAVSTVMYPLQYNQATQDGFVRFFFDYRILAGVRRAHNRGVF